jgi:predicted NUDIX family NTP pyrophosphohydrolase
LPSSKISAGLMLYRRRSGGLEVFLVHPGGPFWARKDAGAWSIAKGEVEPGEDLEAAALREFEEETSLKPRGDLLPLGSVRQTGGKVVHGFALEADCDPAAIRSNRFDLEWPPRSGKTVSVPEIDRAEWFALDAARARINPAQAAFLDRLAALAKPARRRTHTAPRPKQR